MITKEQAMTADNFIQVAYFKTEQRMGSGCMLYRVPVDINNPIPLEKPLKYRRNGKTKLWKTRPDEYRIPIKSGLKNYGYIDQTNAHLFEVAE